MFRNRKWAALCLVFAFLFATGIESDGVFAAKQNQPNGAFAAEQIRPNGASDEAKLDIGAEARDKDGLSKAEKKLGSDLLTLVDEDSPLTDQSRADQAEEMQEQGCLSTGKVTDDKSLMDKKAYVYIQLQPGTDVGAVDGAVSKVVNRDREENLVVGWVKLSALENLAKNGSVKTVQTVLPPYVNTGSVTSEGDSVLKADLARAQEETDGSGVKVGVISDGVDNLASAVATGDLPADVTVLSNTEGGDEGTAMLEIVHDLAPGADLYFHDCGSNVVAFNQAIDDLVAAGCTVVCDDISWPAEPFFEDGIVADHVKALVEENEVVYTTSAGNAARRHYQGTFYNDGNDYHDFSRGTSDLKHLYVYVPPGGKVTVVLEWNDSFGSSGNDYDLYLADYDTGEVYEESEFEQSGSQDPLEWVVYQNWGTSEIDASIWVQAYDNPSPRILEVYIYCDYEAENYTNNIVTADSIMGQAAVPGALACGAVAADTPDTIEWFSSRGPVTMLSGTRAKPDVCATDGVSVTGAGGFSNPFYGTSASSPHVAAVAALVQSKHPALTASEVCERIVDASTDLGASGFDTIYGNGLVDALAATGTFYDVTFDSQGGSAVESISAPEGKTMQAPQPPTRSGFAFDGWYKDADCTLPWDFDTDTVDSNFTLYAKWLVKYTIGAAPNNGAYGTVAGAGAYAVGTSTTVSATPKAGYRFVRWLEGSTQVSTSAAYTFTVTGDRTLTAVFASIGRPSVKTASASYASVRLSWGAVTGASGYEVCRTSSSGSTVYSRASTTSTSYTKTGLTTGKTYYFKVRAYCITGGKKTYGSYSSVVSARPVPARPAAKAASASYNSVRISWDAVSGASGYVVYRMSSTGSKVYGRASTTSTRYTSTRLRTGSTYYYKVRAYRVVNGERVYGSSSSLVHARPVPSRPAAKAASASYNSVRISWGAVSGASGYVVYRTSSTGSKVYGRASTTSTRYTSTRLRTGSTYYYKVRAYRVVNGKRVYGSSSSLVHARPVPSRPAGVQAVRKSASSIRVSWSFVSGASGYELCRTSSDGSKVYSRTATTRTYKTNTGLTTGRTYYYKVRAYRLVDGKRVYGRYSSVVRARL